MPHTSHMATLVPALDAACGRPYTATCARRSQRTLAPRLRQRPRFIPPLASLARDASSWSSSSPTTRRWRRWPETCRRNSRTCRSSSSSGREPPPAGIEPPTSPWPLLDAMDDGRRDAMPPASSASESGALDNDNDSDTFDNGGAVSHWTLSDPLTEACECSAAVAREADVSVELARELLDMGAVYIDSWPEGPEGKVKWQRANALDRILQPGKTLPIPFFSSLLLYRHRNQSQSRSSPVCGVP